MDVLSLLQPRMSKAGMLAMLSNTETLHRGSGRRVVFAYWLDPDDIDDTRRVADRLRAAFTQNGAVEVEANELEGGRPLRVIEVDDEHGGGGQAFRIEYAGAPILTIEIFRPGTPGGDSANWTVRGTIGDRSAAHVAARAIDAFDRVADDLEDGAITAVEWGRARCEIEERGAFTQ